MKGFTGPVTGVFAVVLVCVRCSSALLQHKQRCPVLEDQLVDLVVYAMERSETEEQFDDGGTSQLLWQHLSSQLIFFVLFQFASFPHMVLSLHQKVQRCGGGGGHVPNGACTSQTVHARPTRCMHVPNGACTSQTVHARPKRCMHVPNGACTCFSKSKLKMLYFYYPVAIVTLQLLLS